MGKFGRFMLGLWVFFVTIGLLELAQSVRPDVIVENAYLTLLFIVLSCLTASAVWLSE